MKLYLGTDICEVNRIKKFHIKFNDKFLNKIFTTSEINYCTMQPKKMYQSLTARFAVKEAVSKALGVGINGLGWKNGIDFKDVEIIRSENGSISLLLSGKALIFQNKLKINNWSVSVSHSENYATATVIGYL
ncbi:MAG: holo-ACP synthase [bacterium]